MEFLLRGRHNSLKPVNYALGFTYYILAVPSFYRYIITVFKSLWITFFVAVIYCRLYGAKWITLVGFGLWITVEEYFLKIWEVEKYLKWLLHLEPK